MKTIFCILILLTGCTQKQTPSDDYVLIEFASKLEEDYQKLHPPTDKDKK